MTQKKRADDIGREIHREQDGPWIEGARVCLTMTIFMSLTDQTEAAFRDGTAALMQDVEAAVRKHLPAVAIGHPPVVICFSQLPDEPTFQGKQDG